MLRLRLLSALPLLALLGCHGPPLAGPLPSAVDSAQSPALAVACPPEPARCTGDADLELCSSPPLAWTLSHCDDRSLCLGGACVSLATPGAPAPGAIERRRLLALRGEGWLNGWSIASGLPPSEAQRIQDSPAAATAVAPGLAYRALCAPDGFVAAPANQKQSLFFGHLVAGKKRKVRFEVGAAGHVRIVVGGAVVLDVDRPSSAARPFADEAEAVVALEQGVNPIAVLTGTTGDGGAGFFLRVRELDNQPARDLLFAAGSPAADCGANDLLHVEATPGVVAGGFDVAVTAAFEGLAPRNLDAIPFAAALRRGDHAAVDLSRGSPRLADLETAAAHFTVPARMSTPGAYDLLLTLGDGDAASHGDGASHADAGPRGEVAPRRFPLEYAGPLHNRVAALRARLDALALPPSAAPALSPALPEASRSSLEQHVRTLADALAAGDPDRSWIEERTADAEKLLTAAESGADPYRARTGLVYRAYRSRLDDKLQPYVAFVPRSYKPNGKPLPLILVVHGLTHQPEHALRTLIGEGPDDSTTLSYAAHHLPDFPEYPAILVAPWVYGTSGARQLGEDDILRVVEEMRGAYRVDPLRVSLTGYSMGGTVSFMVPLHYPDRFSAAAPLCGYPNLTAYDSVRTVPHTPWEDVLIAKRYIVNYAENGAHVPLNIVHGGQDNPARSAVVADRYAALGYFRVFDVQDEIDHKIQDYAYDDNRLTPWLAGWTRPRAPSHVRFVSGEVRYDSAYWVHLLAMRDSALSPAPIPGEAPARDLGPYARDFASIDARWADGEVRLRTHNVTALAVDLGALGAKAARVVVNGKALDAPAAGKTAFVQWTDGAWSIGEEAPSLAGRKRAGVSGPLDDVLRHRQLIVYGTQDPAETAANRMVAEHFSSYDTFAYAHFPVKADTDVTDEELRGRSLVLIGNPASNRVTASLVRELPVVFEPGAVTVRGVRYEGEGVGVSLIYPNPRDPEEYVVLHAGVGPRGTLASRHLPQLAPDFLVYDERIMAQRGGLLLDKRPVLAGGFFDDTWK